VPTVTAVKPYFRHGNAPQEAFLSQTSLTEGSPIFRRIDPLKMLRGEKNVKFHLPVIFILITYQTVPFLHLLHGRHTEVTNSMSSSSAYSALKISGGCFIQQAKLQNMQCTNKRIVKARSRNHCCSGKAISITYSECVIVALGIQHAKRMLHIIICSLTSSTIPFTHYLIKGMIFGKKLLNIKCVFLTFWHRSFTFKFWHTCM